MSVKVSKFLYQFTDKEGRMVSDSIAEDRETARSFKRELKAQGIDAHIVQYARVKKVR